MYKALNGMASKYIADLLQPYTPMKRLRSSSKNLLVTPKSHLKFYGDRSFQIAAPMLWNSLTDGIRSIQNLDVFKNKIKTLLFREAFISQLPPFFLLLHIFSLVNLSKSIVSYFLEIYFYNSYIFPVISQICFFLFFQNYDYCKAPLSSRKWRYINLCVIIVLPKVLVISFSCGVKIPFRWLITVEKYCIMHFIQVSIYLALNY